MVLTHADSTDSLTKRPTRPLVLEFWGRLWTGGTWDEIRGDFRCFRVDRIKSLRLTGESFAEEPGKTLADWRRLQGA